MPLFYAVIVIVLLFVFISMLMQILLSPFTWTLLALLLVISLVRNLIYRYHQKKNNTFENTNSNASHQETTKNDDIIDVNYTVVDEDEDSNDKKS